MQLDPLTEKDCEILSEALTAWEAEPHRIGLSTGMLELMLSRGNDEDKRGKMEKKQVEADQATKLRAKTELARRAAQAAALKEEA